MFGVGSIIRLGYLGSARGARGAGSAKLMRGRGGSDFGEGAVSGLRGRGIVVARGFGGMMFARSLGADIVGGTMGFGGVSSMGCCIGATGAGPGMGGMKGCSSSVCGSECEGDAIPALAVELGVVTDLLNAPVALTSSMILPIVGVANVSLFILYSDTLVKVFFFSFIASTVFIFGVGFAFVDAFLTVSFSGNTALSSATVLGLPCFLMAGRWTVVVADSAAGIAIRKRQSR